MKKQFLKKIINLNIFLNITGISFGILYFIFRARSLLFDALSILTILAWLINLYLTVVPVKHLKKSHVQGKKINRMTYYYLITFIIGILALTLGTTFAAFILQGILLTFLELLIILGYFIILIYGLCLTLRIFQTIDDEGVWMLE